MEAGISNSKPKLEKEYNLEFDESKIVLKMRLSESLINISVQYNNDLVPYQYENSFNMKNLIKINKCFLMHESIDEIMNIFTFLIENKKFTFSKINENEISLNLKVQIFIKEEVIGLSLYKIDNMKKDDIINNLINVVKHLTKRVEELEKWKNEKEKGNEKEKTEDKIEIKKIKIIKLLMLVAF